MRKYIIADSIPKCTNGGREKVLLSVDVWEHAYYIDRRNVCPAYLEAWWNLVNWDQVAVFLSDIQPSHLTAGGVFQFSRPFRPLLFPLGHQFYGMRIAFFRLIRMNNLE